MKVIRQTKCLPIFLLAALIGMIVEIPRAHSDIISYAIVQDDASLKVSGRTIRLFGIYIPSTGRFCRTFIRPVRCGSEAVLALNFRIQGFVRCKAQSRNRDGSLNAVCFVDARGSVLEPDKDLSAYLLKQGLAVALPDAPFEYVMLERIARAQRQGIWSDRLRQVR